MKGEMLSCNSRIQWKCRYGGKGVRLTGTASVGSGTATWTVALWVLRDLGLFAVASSVVALLNMACKSTTEMMLGVNATIISSASRPAIGPVVIGFTMTEFSQIGSGGILRNTEVASNVSQNDMKMVTIVLAMEMVFENVGQRRVYIPRPGSRV